MARALSSHIRCDREDLCMTSRNLRRLLRRLSCAWMRFSPGSASPRQGLTFYCLLRRLSSRERSTLHIPSLLRTLQRRQHGNEIFCEPPTIIIKQLSHTLVALRSNNQPGVMLFLHAIDDFRIAVSRRVGKLLTRQRENDSSMLFSRLQSRAACGIRDFEFRPFMPKVNS